jgi:prepilin-type N-terminal cleavage/methylation domain-containing protein
MRRNRGFTLIEISIVIVIIGLLIAGVIQGKSLIQSAKVSNAITLAQDISVAVNAFKQQYHMLPGDMSINTTTPEISNISAGCQPSTGLTTTNNGLIDTIPESQCVPEVLFKAGLAKVDQDNGVPVFKSYYGTAAVKASSTISYLLPSIAAGTFTANHVVEFANLPCDVAQEMDRKMDNDDLTTGKAIATFTPDPNNASTCAAGSIVQHYAVAL